VSGIVVEFESGLEKSLRSLRMIEDILNQDAPRSGNKLKFKRIGFGSGDTQPQVISALSDLLKLDFTIERRVKEPYEKNRFYCTGPYNTAELVSILARIEREAE
jgi:hypothetical protein